MMAFAAQLTSHFPLGRTGRFVPHVRLCFVSFLRSSAVFTARNLLTAAFVILNRCWGYREPSSGLPRG